MRYPAPLRPGDCVGVTSPSSGVRPEYQARLDFSIRAVKERGFEVSVGECMDGLSWVSAPAADRAAELTRMLTDPRIRAVVPPWGGETAIDLLSLLDWDALRAAEPTWLVGYSDISTLLTPLTLLADVATVHGNNLMETPYQAPSGLLSWLDVVTSEPDAVLEQRPPGRHRAAGHDDWTADPGISEYTLDTPGRWRRLDAPDDVTVSGRLIGGCIEALSNLAGTPYADIPRFARSVAPDGLLIYIEAAEADAASICRALHGMRLSGFFTGANAILVGRTRAPARGTLTQDAAVMDALGRLGVPVVADVECGHVAPYLPLINGALATVTYTAEANTITQTQS